MLGQRIWCAYCARHNLSASHPTVIKWDDKTASHTEPQPTGASEIPNIFARWAELQGQFLTGQLPTAPVLHLGNLVNPELVASFIIRGTAVCAAHAWDAIDRAGMTRDGM